MSALKGQIPRGIADHRTKDGRAYTRHVRALLSRLGSLPADARPTLREAGRCALELERLGLSLDEAVARRRRRDASRCRRQLVTLRSQLLTLERRLEELAKMRPAPSLADFMNERQGD
jgi:hypothetical protein